MKSLSLELPSHEMRNSLPFAGPQDSRGECAGEASLSPGCNGCGFLILKNQTTVSIPWLSPRAVPFHMTAAYPESHSVLCSPKHRQYQLRSTRTLPRGWTIVGVSHYSIYHNLNLTIWILLFLSHLSTWPLRASDWLTHFVLAPFPLQLCLIPFTLYSQFL